MIFEDQVAIVTGAGKGLGRAYALKLAELGASVVVNNRSHNEGLELASADQVVREITAAGGSAVANYDNVEDPRSPQRLIEQARDCFCGLHIVVSNAAIDEAATFHKLDFDDFLRVIDIDFVAAARLAHAVYPGMRQQGYGRILVSTSTAGLYGNYGQAAYASAKAALIGLCKTLALEGRKYNVQANAIAPYASTQLTDAYFPPDSVATFSAQAVSSIVAWLVSKDCELNGDVVVSGGGSLRLARPEETDVAKIEAAEIDQIVSGLAAVGYVHNYDSANAEFAAFLKMVADLNSD